MAKTIIDELVTLIGLKLSPGTLRAMNAFTGGLGGMLKSSSSLNKGLSAVSSGLLFFSGRTAHAVANNARLAKAVGVNVETLQEFQFAAKETGASADDINSAFLSLTKSINNYVPGKYNRTLVLLNEHINSDLKGNIKDAASVFMEVVKLTSRMSKEKRLNVFSDLGFSPQLITLINRGQIGIAKLLIEARKIGAVLPASDIKKVITLDENFTRLKSTLNGLKLKALVNLSPILNKIVMATESWAIANVGLFGSLSNILLSGVFRGFSIISSAASGIASSLNKIDPTALKSLAGVFKGIVSAVTVAGIGFLVAKFALLIAKASGLTTAMRLLRFALIGVAALIGTAGTITLGVVALAAAIGALVISLGKLGNIKKIGSAKGINKALGLGTTPDSFLSKKLPGNPFKSLMNFSALGTGGSVSGIGASDNSKTNTSNVTHNTTINVNGSKDPKATAGAIHSLFGGGGLTLNDSAKMSNPGFNRPAVA